jgi:hypothetical protein
MRPNVLWVTDLTYVPTRSAMAYVCCIVDTSLMSIDEPEDLNPDSPRLVGDAEASDVPVPGALSKRVILQVVGAEESIVDEVPSESLDTPWRKGAATMRGLENLAKKISRVFTSDNEMPDEAVPPAFRPGQPLADQWDRLRIAAKGVRMPFGTSQHTQSAKLLAEIRDVTRERRIGLTRAGEVLGPDGLASKATPSVEM